MTAEDKVQIQVLRLRGEINLEDSLKLKNLLSEYMKGGLVCIALDMTHVDHIQLSAGPVLVERAQRLREYGGDLKMFGLSHYLHRVLDLAGMKGHILNYKTEDDMLYAFSAHDVITPPLHRRT